MGVEEIRLVGLIIAIIMVSAAIAGGIMLLMAAFKLRNMSIPPDASFAQTLHLTPLFVVVAIDLLDLSLDVLAAPVSWIVLDRLGLKALRGVAAIEAVIPGTQLIPTLTICWFGVRMLGINY